ncbi:MAG: Holo-[acyl-carrier protein] synthase (EC [uncultured Campylobacterales bacterium]|uniref:Holo-[acyl-carrier-protein] synthase n=1 Tax=uncultured Campylobacterales bacterium TaxID=352960 RepID=A0A6S6SKS3_9BACT|nr:MAG: Holo-[acyl-carrier protein] synthase (EC [uncultured Campylobacterales bacterium]
MIGIDLVSINRIQKIVDRFGDKGLRKFLSENEIKIAKKTETIAGFYAAKEAVSKALKCGIGSECGFLDIVIKKSDKNAPFLEFSDELIKRFDIKDSSLSITHDGGFAVAVVAIECGGIG